MKILILNWRDIKHEWAGGSEVYIFELAKRWVKMGHKVSLFCGQDIREKLPDEDLIDGIKIYRKGGRYSLYFWAIWYYFKKLRRECDTIVDVQNGIPFFSILYSRKPKIAIVYHVHGRQFFIELPFPLNLIGFITEKFIFPLFYSNIKIMAISETTKKALIKLGFNKKNIPRARLLIAGWGTEASAVADLSMRSIQRRRVRIIGPVSEFEKRLLLSRSWVFVNPSIGEGWGISIIEANLYGSPAIAFKVAGLSESIKTGETGYLVSNEKELIEKICLLLSNEKKRVTLSRNAKDWASSFSWENAANESIEIIERTARSK